MKNIFLCFVLTVILFASGCKEDESSTNPNSTNIVFQQPSVGDRADYRMISGSDTTTFYYVFVKKYANNVFKALQYITWNGGGTDIDTLFWVIVTEEWREVSDSTAAQSGMRIFKDMELNRAYNFNLLPNSRWGTPGETFSIKLVSKNESVSVPAGNFNCLKLIMKSLTNSQFPETIIYLDPKAGQVKIVNNNTVVVMVSKNF